MFLLVLVVVLEVRNGCRRRGFDVLLDPLLRHFISHPFSSEALRVGIRVRIRTRSGLSDGLRVGGKREGLRVSSECPIAPQTQSGGVDGKWSRGGCGGVS